MPDQIGGEGDRTVTITLSEPGGCATLGSPITAELTIRDDDPSPPTVQPFGLDPTFGTGGKATTTPFGGDSTTCSSHGSWTTDARTGRSVSTDWSSPTSAR